MRTPSPLVGRDEERAALLDALAECSTGSGGLLLVSGETGVGKSRLVTEALADFAGRRVQVTATAGARAYAPLMAAVGGRSTTREASWHEDPTSAVEVACRALASGGPAAVVLDDLHQADAATIEVLPALAEAMASESLLLIGIYRSDELPRAHPLRGLRAELRRRRRLTEIVLRPLTEANTAELLTAFLGAAPAARLVDAVHTRAEGLPFFVEELAAALRDGQALVARSGTVDLADDAVLPLPESVVDAVLVGTSAVRAGHPMAVDYAATLGVQVDLPALAVLVTGDEVDALLEAGLLLEFDSEVAVFRHALVRDALYRAIPWARRRAHHQRIAELLADRGTEPAVVAEHWIAAHQPGRARPLLLAAAEEHCAVHAYRDAAALARRALALWPSAEDPDGRLATMERLAECAELSGEPGASVTVWADVAHHHEAAGNLADAGAAYRRAANAAVLVGDQAAATGHRSAAADAFSQAGHLADAAADRLSLAQSLRAAGRLSDALDEAVAATEAAAAAQRPDLKAHALAFQGAVRSALGDGRRGVQLARAGVEMALAEQLTEQTGETYYALAEALEYAADYAAAVDAYRSAYELCSAHGFEGLAQICYVCMSPAMRLMGDWDRTLVICAQVMADEHSSVLTRRVAEEEYGLLLALRGDRRRCRAPLRRATEFGQANGIFGLEVGATWGLAVAAESDDERTARDRVALLLQRCHDSEECHYALPALRWAATFLARRGDAAGVSAAHRVLATAATRNGSSKVLSALAHVGGELAMVEGDAVQAAAQFGRSVELLAGVTAPYEHAHTGLRRGEAAALLGERDLVVSSLASAYRTACQLAAKPLARRCATVLADMGEPVEQRLGRRAARALDPAALTRREREVLGHLVDGKTNREIAVELFLSTRTVDMHVRNVFTKLGCSSRAAAVRQATAQGLVPAPR